MRKYPLRDREAISGINEYDNNEYDNNHMSMITMSMITTPTSSNEYETSPQKFQWVRNDGDT